ncbi:DUF4190 domain-containing protein [Lapillicoccus jejuensis]|uniref:Uncharacterized protein DUF4190 n=1 Tax=Lapillicoccus jejuensis TaxID=402171 RepID=A0A542E449_9MICO|nr:DUF4190 domain-containing protein [Lapillicoccus jejuensis]TQJ10069.1 uncharacterized protein DUF4190 [Lapillicoccus jejuensis]
MSYGTPPPSGNDPTENDPTAPGGYGSNPPPPPSYGSQDQPSYGAPQQPSYGSDRPADAPSYGQTPPPPAPGSYGAAPTYGQPSPYGQTPPPPYGGANPYGVPAANNTKAIVSLVLGIVGILLCGLLGPVALILGRQAKSEIAVSNGAQKGAGMAQAGFILGIVATVFLVIQIIYVASVYSGRG